MNKVKKFLALSLALVMMLSVASFGAVKEFTDQEDIPAGNLEAVNLLSALNILSGYDDGSFKPAGTITRAEAAKMIYVLCNNGIDDKAEIYKGQTLFVDVEAGSWYEGYVNYCANVNIIAGRGNGVFDPNATVTGYELMKMLLVVAEYKPEIQGYTGGSWASAVLRDASTSGMTKDCNFSMNDAAPRHWAARLFYNTILNVNAAVYIGDTLFTNPGILGDFSQLVGHKKLGLQYDKVYVIGTQNAKLSAGADVYKYSEVKFVEANSRIGVAKGKAVEINYEIPTDYLGQEVRLVYKLNNSNLDFTMSNTTVFGVYPTGTSLVYDTSIDAVTVGKKLDTDENFVGLTIKFSDYNSGKAMTYENGVSPTTYNNAFKNQELSFDKFYALFGTNSADTVRFVDQNGDGYLDYAFITETKYYRVNNLTTLKANFTNGNNLKGLNLDIEDVNFIDEVVREDIVAITENYATGEVVYDVRKIDSTTVKASKWTRDETGVTSVTLDGTAYKLAKTAHDQKLDYKNTVYYLDKGFVVASKVAADSDTLPANLAIVTRVGQVVETVDSYKDPVIYFYVDYLKADGTKVSAKYDLGKAEENEAIIKLSNAEFNAKDKADYDACQPEIKKLLDNCDIVMFTKTDYGVYFEEYDGIGTNALASYSDDNKVINVSGQGKFNVPDSSYFFARYEATSGTAYTVIKAADLKAFSATKTVNNASVDYAKVREYQANLGNMQTAYLVFDGALPTATTKTNYAVITGGAGYGVVGTTDVMFVNALDSNGDTITMNVPLTNSFFKNANVANNAASLNAYIAACKLTVVSYTVSSSDLYTPTLLSKGSAGQITSTSGDNFVFRNALLTTDEDTIVFYIAGGSASILSGVMTTNANSAYVVSTSGDWATVANLVIINNDVDANGVPVGVLGTNVVPKAVVYNLTCTGVTDVGATFTFSDLDDDDEYAGYDIMIRKYDPDAEKYGEWEVVALADIVDSTSTSVEIKGLDDDTQYQVRLDVDGGPKDGFSNTVTFTTNEA